MEEDYYKLLDLHYNSSLEEINNVCKIKLSEFKLLPFLSNSDKIKKNKIKKALYIFNDSDSKNIYDEYIKKKYKKKKNNLINHNDYIINRIFDIKINDNFNYTDNELLRPKNVGLISDKNVEEDENIEESDMFREDDNFKAYNY
jgi:DnaJ-class molecular chaperone